MTNWLTGPLSRAKKRAVSPRFWLKSLRDLLIFATVLYAISSYLQRDMLTGTAFPINSPLIDGREVSFFIPGNKAALTKQP